MRTDALRILLYSHDSQGLGHTRRNLALAHALARRLPELTGRPVTGLLLTGIDTATSFEKPDGFDWAVLPGIAKDFAGYGPRNLGIGMKHLTALRSGMIDAALFGFRPDLVIVDRHAWGVADELRGPLARLRAQFPDTRIVLGLREVLDAPAVTAGEWRRVGDLDGFRAVYSDLWVYGDRGVHDPVATGEIPAELAGLVSYTGYLSAGRPLGESVSEMTKPYIVSMAGGGADGMSLLTAAARAEVPHGYRHLVIAGPQMPAPGVDRILAEAGPRTTVVGSVPDALAEVAAAAAVISMGGYNSTAEILTTNTPALIVPRERPRQEQLIRARALAARGAVEVLRQRDLSARALSDWMSGAVGTVRLRHDLDLGGLHAVGGLAARALSETPRPVATPGGVPSP